METMLTFLSEDHNRRLRREAEVARRARERPRHRRWHLRRSRR
jgi:hypothetical protein